MLKLLFVLLCCIQIIYCYKILVVSPTPAPSHNILGHGYVKHLLGAGHEVTYITSKFYDKPHPKLRQIDLTSHYNLMIEQLFNIRFILESKAIKMSDASDIIEFMFNIHNATLTHPNVLDLINDVNEQFDLVVVEWAYSEVISGFAAVFDCPYIWSSTLDPHWFILSLVDESTNPAYTVDIASTHIPPLNFMERLEQLWFQIEMNIVEQFYMPTQKAAYNKAFGPAVSKRGRVLPPLEVMRYNASMILGNSNPPFSPPIRLPANYKEIGGFHIDAHTTPLPQNLKKIMDEAKHGVIYFSLGSNVKSKDMPEQMKRDLLKVFGELKQVVLWKFEEELAGLPQNVHILKWAPQPSILAHPNCLVFVSHGGLLSLTETIHHGVPIVGIPVFADQFINVNKAVAKGFGIKVSLDIQMATPLKKALVDIINDKSYRETAKRLSSIYHDRLVSPGAELVHWVEHVVRTGGAAHLKSPALMVPWYQKMYLDLIALILAFVYIIKRVLNKLFFSKSNKKIKRN